jgi:hypothetical protein
MAIRKMTSIQHARNSRIFVIENETIVETNLYDHVMESAKEVTSPRGIWNEYFSEEIMVNDDQGEPVEKYAVKQWLGGGQKLMTVHIYDTWEEAEDYVFERIYKFDFQKDDQRDTFFFNTREEAEKELNDRLNG